MNLDKLISQVDFNPYLYWPNTTNERVTRFINNIIEQESTTSQVFKYYHNNRIIIYFQIKELKWDSEFFGYNCGQIKNLLIDNNLSYKEIYKITKKIIVDVHNYIELNKYKFLFADINSRCSNSNFFINELGFNFILNWIDGFVISNKLKLLPIFYNDIEICLANNNDIGVLSEISEKFYYKYGRFYSDLNFNNKKVDEMYKSLVYDSFVKKRVILVIKKNNKVIGGFISNDVTCYDIFNNLKVAHLRFLVVHPEYRGFEIGKNLFLSILNYFSDKTDIVVTGLEAHNTASLNLHSKLGFKFNYVHNAYHLRIL